MRHITLVVTIFAVITITCLQVSAQQQIPEDTYYNLRYTFTMLREHLWEENDRFWHNGEFSRCIAVLRLITQVDPQDVEAYSSGAWLMESELRDDEAEAFLLEGVKNNQDIYDMYFELGSFYYYHEQYDLAIPYLETAATFEAPVYVRHQLAHAYEQSGNPETALELWLQMEYESPDDKVPQIQIDRLMRAEAGESIPAFLSRAREQRKEEQRKILEKSANDKSITR